MKSFIALLSGIAVWGSAHAELLASQGATGILSVQYEYSSIGKRTDKDEPGEWRVQRTIKLIVPMTADGPQPLSSLRAMDSTQSADLAKKQAQIKDFHTKTAPMAADMMKIAEKCGDSEACVEKAVAEYGSKMNLAEVGSLKADATALGKQAGPRYQLWQPVSQKGTYLVDETYRAQTSDPLCTSKPNHRCRREETRKGGGDIPAPTGMKMTSAALLEVDSMKQDVLIRLPIPLSALGYSRQITSDFPDEKSGTSSGTLPSMFGQQKSITAAIPGDLRPASGTQSFKVDGAEGQGGTLVVKWQFALQ